MSQPARPQLRALPRPGEMPPEERPQASDAVQDAPKIARKKIGIMDWLERRSQPYIVIATAIAAVIRGFYLFTDKLINLAHYPELNGALSIITGIIMSVTSELTISIAGRRHKLYKAQLYVAEMSAAGANKATKPIWDVEVRRLQDQVKANLWAMRISMGMSLVAAASYLIDSTGAKNFLAFVIASSLAGYVLYMMYYHGVQTDEIREDGTQETAETILETLNVIRVEEVARLRSDLAEANLSVPARLALIASGLPIPAQRQVMPTIKLLLGREDRDGNTQDETADWWNMRDLAMACGEDFFSGRKADDITRKYRRRCADNAEKYRDDIRMDSERGWIVRPSFAIEFWNVTNPSYQPQEDGSTPGMVDGSAVELE